MPPSSSLLTCLDGAADRASLLPSVDVPTYVSTRDRIAQLLTSAHGMLLEARDLMSSSQMGDLDMLFEPRSYRRNGRAKHVGAFTSHDGLSQFLQYVDAHGWQYLLRETGAGSFMDADRRAELRTQLDDGNVPAISLSNVQTTLGTLIRDRGTMLRDGISSLFRALSWDHKSNLPSGLARVLFSDRIRLTNGFRSNGSVIFRISTGIAFFFKVNRIPMIELVAFFSCFSTRNVSARCL